MHFPNLEHASCSRINRVPSTQSLLESESSPSSSRRPSSRLSSKCYLGTKRFSLEGLDVSSSRSSINSSPPPPPAGCQSRSTHHRHGASRTPQRHDQTIGPLALRDLRPVRKTLTRAASSAVVMSSILTPEPPASTPRPPARPSRSHLASNPATSCKPSTPSPLGRAGPASAWKRKASNRSFPIILHGDAAFAAGNHRRIPQLRLALSGYTIEGHPTHHHQQPPRLLTANPEEFQLHSCPLLPTSPSACLIPIFHAQRRRPRHRHAHRDHRRRVPSAFPFHASLSSTSSDYPREIVYNNEARHLHLHSAAPL